jgi:hypothetical protein
MWGLGSLLHSKAFLEDDLILVLYVFNSIEILWSWKPYYFSLDCYDGSKLMKNDSDFIICWESILNAPYSEVCVVVPKSNYMVL